jgi:hypothetical protein
VELPRRVAVDVAIQAGHAQAGVRTLAVIGRVEFLLWEGGKQQAQTIELNWGEHIFG